MSRLSIAAWAALALAGTSGVAWACADSGCEVNWKLAAQELDCASRAMLAPGNDTRVNMLLLLRDRGGLDTTGLKPVEVEYAYDTGGETFYSWRNLNGGLFPGKYDYWSGFGAKDGDRRGGRCMSLAGGDAGFAAAVAANKSVPVGERAALSAARARLVEACEGKEPSVAWANVSSPAGQAFLGYLQASEAFYREDFTTARQGYAALTKASDPWVAETASYMTARVALNAAQANSVDDYGWFKGIDSVDQGSVRAAGAALGSYLKAFPAGRYAASAQGLQRRVAWLAGDRAGLAKAYAGMLGKVDPGAEAATTLVEEIDNKLIVSEGAVVAEGPLLRATMALMRMRPTYGANGEGPAPLTAAELEAQAPQFASDKPLFDFLRATHAFYVAKDFRRVLALLPDDARAAQHSNLSFSRQTLRGMALAALKDRNEAGFWQELLSGTTGSWQRSTVELGLAMNWERNGKVDAVFAPGSPVTDPSIRQVLLINSATAPVLRRVVTDRTLSPELRDKAQYTLLTNELIRGDFTAFAADLKLSLAKPDGEANIFSKGKVGDGYPCAPIAVTAAALAKSPQDVPGRLCLGDFMRINGLDYYEGTYWRAPKPDELGGHARGFTTPRQYRSAFYTSVIGNPRAAPNDKAYALYRAVMCYAPSGINDCGGADVPVAQRKAWFTQLKRDYPASQWAKKLRVYW
jgi:hypothetical protein